MYDSDLQTPLNKALIQHTFVYTKNVNGHVKWKEMLKERKLWSILRGLEIKYNARVISRKILVEEVLKRNACVFLPFMRFSDEEDVLRVFNSLMMQKYTHHESCVIDGKTEKGVQTEPIADKLFLNPFSPYFWSKWVDSVGFWKILTLTIAILGFVPNGFAYLIIERLFG